MNPVPSTFLASKGEHGLLSQTDLVVNLLLPLGGSVPSGHSPDGSETGLLFVRWSE